MKEIKKRMNDLGIELYILVLSCALGLHLLAETQDQVKDIKKRMNDLGIELYILVLSCALGLHLSRRRRIR